MSSPLKRLLVAGVICCAAWSAPAAQILSSIVPAELRCEYRADPLGIDSAKPRLGWILQPARANAQRLRQTAYEVLVATSPERLAAGKGDLWDSGKVVSDQMNQIPYGGAPLVSGERVWWSVRAWDQDGIVSGWSPAAQWTMGVLTQADWSGAKWIAAPGANAGAGAPVWETVLLRREFTVKPGLKRALVDVCGLGQYEMTLNGRGASEDVLAPGWTWYGKTCLYNTYDITSRLRPGANAAGLFLGNGFYNIHKGRYTKVTGTFGPVQAIALIRLEYLDGSVETVVTDEQWKAAPGPITFSSIYGGEDYDARLVKEGWDTPKFDDLAWQTPAVTAGPGGTLKGLSASGPPVRRFEELLPVSAFGKPVDGGIPVGDQLRIEGVIGRGPLNAYARPGAPGVIVFDLGQNASIMLNLFATGPAGSSIKVTPAEDIKPNGDISDPMCGGNSYWTYTLSGKGFEGYRSHFYYRGGRYLKVELRPAPRGTELPKLEYISGSVIHADAPAVGQFSCSSPLYNNICKIIRWAQMNNMMSVLTDCPTREKLGWLEEDHLNGPALRYNFDLSTLLTKMVCDMQDSQAPNGLVPSTCPNYLRLPPTNRFANPPEWGSASIIVPWQQYLFDGDTALMGEHYDMMTRYLAYLEGAAKENIVNFGLGDWYDHGGFGAATLTPIALTATAYYYRDAWLLSRMAALLGKEGNATAFDQTARRVLDAFNAKFFDAATDEYATGSQASNAVPLAMDMAPAEHRAAVVANLVSDVQAKEVTVGEVCLESLLTALASAGRSDVIYTACSSSTCGYGLQVALRKTSLTEGWNGGASQDHFMFGELNEWFYAGLAGIQCDPAGPGFRKIIICPSVVGDLTSVNASYDSISGRIVSEWRRTGSRVRLHVVIPPNTTARVFLPGGTWRRVETVGSGDWNFESSL